MSRDAFRRLALLAGCTAYAVALVLVGRFVWWPAALAGLLLGSALTLLCTVEQRPPEPEPPAVQPDERVDGRRMRSDRFERIE